MEPLLAIWGRLKDVHPLALDLLKRILVPAEKRCSLEQIMVHPWVNDETANTYNGTTPKLAAVPDRSLNLNLGANKLPPLASSNKFGTDNMCTEAHGSDKKLPPLTAPAVLQIQEVHKNDSVAVWPVDRSGVSRGLLMVQAKRNANADEDHKHAKQTLPAMFQRTAETPAAFAKSRDTLHKPSVEMLTTFPNPVETPATQKFVGMPAMFQKPIAVEEHKYKPRPHAMFVPESGSEKESLVRPGHTHSISPSDSTAMCVGSPVDLVGHDPHRWSLTPVPKRVQEPGLRRGKFSRLARSQQPNGCYLIPRPSMASRGFFLHRLATIAIFWTSLLRCGNISLRQLSSVHLVFSVCSAYVRRMVSVCAL